jgi:hypothetical protein
MVSRFEMYAIELMDKLEVSKPVNASDDAVVDYMFDLAQSRDQERDSDL